MPYCFVACFGGWLRRPSSHFTSSVVSNIECERSKKFHGSAVVLQQTWYRLIAVVCARDISGNLPVRRYMLLGALTPLLKSEGACAAVSGLLYRIRTCVGTASGRCIGPVTAARRRVVLVTMLRGCPSQNKRLCWLLPGSPIERGPTVFHYAALSR